MVSPTAADGLSVYYAHDAVNRVVRTLYPDGGYTYFEYDLGSNLTAARDDRGWSYFAYDAVSRLTGERHPDALEVTHVYDAAGQRTALSVSATGTAYYTNDPVGRMVSAQAARPEVGTAYYQYRPDGLLVKKTLGNGCYTYFAHDEARRLSQLLNCFPDGRPLVYFEYGYDAGSRITSVRREDGNVIYYGYDVVNRLTSEEWYDSGMNQLYAFQWDYDPAGNRTYEKRGDVEAYYTYDAASELLHTRKLPGDEWTYFQYDPRGNTVAIQEPDGTTYFSYNPLNLVTAIAYKTGIANYFYYDSQMRRYAIEESAGLSYFTWDTNGMNLLCERGAGGNVTADYAHGYAPTDGIGSITAARKPVAETMYYQYPIYDHRGDVLRLVDEAGNVTSAYEYNAWGIPLHDEESSAPNRFRYQSNWIELKDSGGPMYATEGGRLYDARVGAFLQRDPLASSPGLYSYADNDPLGSGDPRGLFKEEWKGRWPGGQDQQVKDSMERVNKRIDVLVAQMDAELADMKKDPACYGDLITKVETLRQLLLDIQSDIKSPTKNLEIYRKDIGTSAFGEAWPPYPRRWWNVWWAGHDFELRLNTNRKKRWFSQAEDVQDRTMLHELSHLRWTDDGKAGNNWNDAGVIEWLMTIDFPRWGDYSRQRQLDDLRRAAGECCVPPE
jgi:RHS repeat-associated protein